MARIFGRNLENPERRIETEGDFTSVVSESFPSNEYDDYEDEFDKKLDEAEAHEPSSAKKAEFIQSIKVEQPRVDTPLALAYKELGRARQTRDKEAIIKAEDKILDLERQEEEKEYHLRIAELKKLQKEARQSNNPQDLKRFSQMRTSFVKEMKYDELNYKISKLQNSQRLNPSREKLQQIIELKKELEELEMEQMSK